MSDFHGIILYSIELDGCLNGVWTNQPNGGKIHNEIAKRTEVEGNDPIAGTYLSSYIEIDDNIYSGKLTITRPVDNVYSFKWVYEHEKEEKIFTGIGYQINKYQIAVNYWEGK